MNDAASSPEVVNPNAGMPSPLKLLRLLVYWLILYAILLTVYNKTYHITSEVMIRRLQVIPAVKILEVTLPDMTFRHTSTEIISPQLELQILRGCDGVEAWLMLLTALFIFPMPWKQRWKGVLWGTVLIFSVNLVRIVSLFHLVLRKPEWFDVAHGVIWQSVIVLLAAAFVLSWLDPQRIARAEQKSGPDAT